MLRSLCLLFLLIPAAHADQARFFETLQVGEAIYRQVRVREVNAKWLIILHSEGISQVPLAKLSPDLQTQFGYDSRREAAFDEALQRQPPSAPPAASLLPRAVAPRTVEVRPEVDLRPQFFKLGLHTKNQGRRPSCTVFALLAPIEFHYSARAGRALPLSEEYLIWATMQVNPGQQDPDGFSFGDVIRAIRRHGLARSELMPNTFRSFAGIQPGAEAVADAATRGEVSIHAVFGSPEAKIEAMIRELNEGWPVAISLRWPDQRTLIRTHTLREQRPVESNGHAVSVVGYQQKGHSLDDVLFIFRNSYGPRWGMGGYGLIAYSYLQEHLHDVLLFKVMD